MAEQSKKKTVLAFSASWIPAKDETASPHCSMSGVVQTIDTKPTSQRAFVIYRDFADNGQPTWWPGVTIPGKKQISYGPAFEKEEFNKTDLHQVTIAKGNVISVTGTDGIVLRYQIESVEVLAG